MSSWQASNSSGTIVAVRSFPQMWRNVTDDPGSAALFARLMLKPRQLEANSAGIGAGLFAHRACHTALPPHHDRSTQSSQLAGRWLTIGQRSYGQVGIGIP